jgi:hypothetical protein
MARTSKDFRPTGADSFDPEILEVLGQAYDMAIAAARDIGRPNVPRDVIAKRIFKAAEEGEDDPVVLCAIGLGAVS